ncbi:MAG TPA: glycosyltransferase family 2 protein [Chloroflexota bacterium]|nr:glycosyltransferase family 2 protein [Chloroflexota bacterium]
MARISAVVVNWNTRDLLRRCLLSLYASAGVDNSLEVLVVDNGSTDGSPELVRSEFPQAILIANKDNLGFARANNQAMSKASGDYLLLANTDTEMVGAAVEEMVHYAEQHPQVAVVGPQLLNSDGTIQSSRRSFPTAATAFLESTVLQRWFASHPAVQHYYLLERPDDETQEVGWLVGACLLVRAEACRQVGPMDEGYFMYSEEMDWCRRFSDAGWKIVYLPTAKVVHHEGQSSGRDIYHRHTRFQFSKCRYFEIHSGRWFAQLLRVFLLGNYLFLWFEDVAKLLLLKRNRSMRRERISVLARVIRWQLRWVARCGKIEP